MEAILSIDMQLQLILVIWDIPSFHIKMKIDKLEIDPGKEYVKHEL